MTLAAHRKPTFDHERALARGIAASERDGRPEEAERLRWTLALGATALVRREAHRLAASSTVPEEDLAQEGWFGLLTAADRYDPDRSIRFATYARWWVRAAMTRAIEAGRVVRLSGSAAEQLRNLRKQIRIDEATRGADATLAGAAAKVGLDADRARDLLEAGRLVALDAPGDEDAPAFELTAEGPTPEDVAETNAAAARLHDLLRSELPARARAVLRRRYGLDGRDPASLVEVGRRVGLSRERVRQIEGEALRVLHDAWHRRSP